ncbi:MAG TPA: hypothetical protein PK208_04380 [Fibrobacteria bacterium]|nr:hypothetical protein [Fibrobacteria bacterium]
MIAAMLALLGALGASGDRDSPVAQASLFAGPRVGEVLGYPLWFELGSELDVLGGLLRFDASMPVVLDPDLRMDSGQTRPDPTRLAFTAAAGKTWRKDRRWLSVGGGWMWARADELRTVPESREVMVQDSLGLRSENWDRSPYVTDAGKGWVWNEPVSRNGPYFFGEIGTGGESVGLGLKLEYRFALQAGLNLRVRFDLF